MELLDRSVGEFEELMGCEETLTFGESVSRRPDHGNSVSGFTIDDGELLELSVFLKTILAIEDRTRVPRCRAERRMDAVIHNQAKPQSYMEVLFKRWTNAGRPLEGIRLCEQNVTEGDWANFDYPNAHRYGQKSSLPPHERYRTG